MSKLILAALTIAALSVLATAQSTQAELMVKGRVLDAQGNPVIGAQVTVGPTGTLKGGLVPMGKSDEQGEFSVVVHQTGAFFVSASKTIDHHQSTANRFYYPILAKTALINVVPGESTPFTTVQFGPKEGLLTIQAFDMQTREPVRQVMISLCRTEAPKYCHRVLNGNTRGMYSVSVPDAPFTLQLTATGYVDAYGEDLDQEGLQVMQIASGATRQIIIGMERSTSSKNLLPAPKLVSPADGIVFWDTPHPRNLTVEWTPVPGAKSYTVEVEACEWQKPDGGKCETGTMPLTRWRQEPPPTGIEGTKYEFVFPGTQPGRWRVWAVDEKGRPGAKSAWSFFFYKSELTPALIGTKP